MHVRRSSSSDLSSYILKVIKSKVNQTCLPLCILLYRNVGELPKNTEMI